MGQEPKAEGKTGPPGKKFKKVNRYCVVTWGRRPQFEKRGRLGTGPKENYSDKQSEIGKGKTPSKGRISAYIVRVIYDSWQEKEGKR